MHAHFAIGEVMSVAFLTKRLAVRFLCNFIPKSSMRNKVNVFFGLKNYVKLDEVDSYIHKNVLEKMAQYDNEYFIKIARNKGEGKNIVVTLTLIANQKI